MKYENLNLLESSGRLQACNGTALPYLTLTFLSMWLILIAEVSKMSSAAGALGSNPAWEMDAFLLPILCPF